MDTSAENWEGHLWKRNAIVFALFAMSTLRISLKKQSRQRFSVLTQDPYNQAWFEQDVILEIDANVGLPTPTDETVLMALIEMTRHQEPASHELVIGKSEFADFLKWRQWTQSKNRLEHSLRLFAQIKLTFSKGRWDEISGAWIPFNFAIFDKVDIDGDNYRLEWNAPVYASLRSTNYGFAFQDYQKFENAIARRIYLMTNRVLAERRSVTLVLRDFFEKVLRMHVGYSPGHMQRGLVKAFQELEIKGYIKAATLLDRFPEGTNVHFEAGPMFQVPLMAARSNRNPELESTGLHSDSDEKLVPLEHGAEQFATCLSPVDEKLSAQPESSLPTMLRELPVVSDSPTSWSLLLACRNAVQVFWESLPHEVKLKLETEALSIATPLEKELMETDSRLSVAIKQDLMRLHAIRVMASL